MIELVISFFLVILLTTVGVVRIKALLRQDYVDDVKTSIRLAISCGHAPYVVELIKKHEREVPEHVLAHAREWLNQN